MRKWYENGLRIAEDDHEHLSLVSVISIIKCFIWEEEVCHIETHKKFLRYQSSSFVVASQWLYWYEKMIWKWIVKCWRWSYRTNSIVGGISNWVFYWRGGSMSYWNSQKVTQISMKLLCHSLTMVILIWENDTKTDWEVLNTNTHSQICSH